MRAPVRMASLPPAGPRSVAVAVVHGPTGCPAPRTGDPASATPAKISAENAPPATSRRAKPLPSSVTRAVRSAPSSSHGSADSTSVSASTRARRSLPSAVSPPSSSSRPRSTSAADSAAHSSSLHPRVALAAGRVNPRPVAVCVISASRPLRSACSSAAMCPSPRCSRSSVAACQRSSSGSPGQPRSACPAYSGRPSGVSASHASRSSPASSANSAESMRLVAEQAGERGAGDVPAGLDDLLRGGQGPRAGDHVRHERRREVVEGRRHHPGPDGAHRRGPPGEVGHPARRADRSR